VFFNQRYQTVQDEDMSFVHTSNHVDHSIVVGSVAYDLSVSAVGYVRFCRIAVK